MKSLNCLTKEVINLLDKNNLLKNLIACELQNEKIKNIKLKEEVIQNIKKSIFKKEGFETEEDFKEWLDKSNAKEKQFFDEITQPLRINEFCLETYRHQSEARFLKRKNYLDQVTYSLLRVNDFYLSQELYLRIKDNPNEFAELASKYSLGEEKSSRGLVGPVSVGNSHPKIQNIMRNCKIGELAEPSLIENVWIFLRVEDMQHSKLTEDMELLMCRELFNESIEKNTLVIYNDLIKEEIIPVSNNE